MNLLDLARSVVPTELQATALEPTANRWVVHFADRDPTVVILTEPTTHTSILTQYPDAVAAEPSPRRYRPATAREALELRLLVHEVLSGDAGRAEALRLALADVDDALTCYRTLTGLPTTPDPAMPRCLDCAAYDIQSGRCGQAAKRISLGTGCYVGTRYRPCYPERPQRCGAFLPLPDSPDQRNGAERWPWLFVEKGQ